jgi:hypothetical protein
LHHEVHVSRSVAAARARLFEDGATFTMPAPIGLLAYRLHPDYDELAAAYVRWVHAELRPRSREELGTILAGRHDLWACLAYPRAKRDRAEVLVRWTSLMFIFDDLTTRLVKHMRIDACTSRAQAMFDLLLAIVRGDDPPIDSDALGIPSARLALLRGVYTDIRMAMTPAQWQRFVSLVAAFAASVVREVGPRAASGGLSFDDLVALRALSSGAAPCASLLEYGLGIDLGDDETEQLRHIRQAFAVQTTLTNDLHSFRAEHYDGDHVNAVAIGCLVDGLTLQDSVDRVSAVIADAERRFVRERDELFGTALGQRTDLRDYVTGLGELMAGNARWSYITGRYHGTEHVWNGRTHGTVTLLPDRTILCEA